MTESNNGPEGGDLQPHSKNAGALTTAQEHMVEMAKSFMLDEFFIRNPKEFTDDLLMRLVRHNQSERALFISKGESARKEKEDE